MDLRSAVDTRIGMIRDLRTILDGWDFEPGKISVRKIIGRDGREKIQTRIDLGVLQLECQERPDGQRPHGYESLLEYHLQRLREHIEINGDDEDFILSPEDCRELRHEAYLYYQRYLSLFVLEEFDGVERDTARNCRLIDLCERYAATEADRQTLCRQRAYVMMMHTRARAYLAAGSARYDTALQIVDEGLATLEALDEPNEDENPHAGEMNTLRALRQEILEGMPADAPAKLQSDLQLALECEDYERAAQLRDRLAQTKEAIQPPTPSAVPLPRDKTGPASH
jgi:hypothetical protein